MRHTAPLAMAALAAMALPTACQGPRGPVVRLSVTQQQDPWVVASVHRLSVALTSSEHGSETLLFPEAGPSAVPIDFPADMAIVLSGVEGEVAIEVTALTASDEPVGWGRGQVTLDAAELVDAVVAVGVATTCGDGVAPAGLVPELCFERFGVELVLGRGEETLGVIANGVEFALADEDELPDLLAVWSEDNGQPLTKSGLSVFHGSWVEGSGITYTSDLEYVLVDRGEPGERRSNTEGAVADVVGMDGAWEPDTLPDLVVSSREAKGLTIWPKAGNGRTNYAEEPLFIPLGELTGALQVGDVLPAPGDEIVVALWSVGRLAIVGHQPESDGFALDVLAELELRKGIAGFRIIDVDGDGDQDLVVSANGVAKTGGEGGLLVLRSDGAGGFDLEDVGPPRTGVNDVVVANLDGDDEPDLASLNWESGTVEVHTPADGDGWVSLTTWAVPAPGERQAPNLDRLRAGDLDGDGVTDLLACDQNGWLHALLLDADGSSRFPPVRLQGGESRGETAKDLQGCAISDSDGDGAVDLLAIVDRTDKRLRVLHRNP